MVKAKKKTKKKAKKQGVVDKTSKPARNAKGQLVSGWGRGSKQVKKKKKVTAPKKKHKRRADGTLLPGQSALHLNTGHTKYGRTTELDNAIARVEEKKDQSFLDMCIEKAWDDTAMAIAILRKKYPDLRSVEQLTVPTDDLSNEEAEKWREEFKERFGK